MFKKPRTEDDFSEIQKLLAMKRSELPPKAYFNGVLEEFHSRQRAALLQPRYTFISRIFERWDAFREAFSMWFQAAPVLRFAVIGSAAIALIATGLKESWNEGTPMMIPSLTLQTSQPVSGSDQFAFEALGSKPSSGVDQQLDAASIASLDNGLTSPHYVMAEAPTSYDTTMAF